MIASFSLLDASITYDADNQLQHHLIHIATTVDGTNNDFESMIEVLKECCEYVEPLQTEFHVYTEMHVCGV